MRQIRFKPFALLLALLTVSSVEAQQTTKIAVNLDVKHKLADVESFDRSKFITLHSTITQQNWDHGNKDDVDYRVEFLDRYDVYCGRATGGITSTLRNVKEDSTRPGFADPDDIARLGAIAKQNYADGRADYEAYESRSNLILCTQHYLYPTGEVLNPKSDNPHWALSTTDTADEPFGTASGEFYAHFIKEFYGKGGSSGEKLPAFCEITNEPLWPLYDFTEGKPQEDLTRVFKFHATVAQEIKKLNPDMPVGGYCTAFPDFDTDNFDRWNKRWKHFIDIAGEDMDFWTIHLYDFPCFFGKTQYRKGSNLEATLDMLEQYSLLKLGEIKPLMVSEYGAQTHDVHKVPDNRYACWLKVKSENAMVLQFMARANNINCVMPYHMLKMEWGGGTNPSSSRLLRRENEPESFTGDYIFNDNVHFYQLWSDVRGTRIDTKSDNIDIQCDAYVDGATAHLIVNNLSFDEVQFELDMLGIDKEPTKIVAKRYYLTDGVGSPAVIDEYEIDNITEPQIIAPEGAYVYAITYDKKIKIGELKEETKYYAKSYMQPIESNNKITFELDDVKVGRYGEATLRLGIGRDHGKSLTPTVAINGRNVNVPTNFKGDDQRDRDNFFGVLEIPITLDDIAQNNSVEITFPDDGGYLTTCTMQVYNISEDIRQR